MHSAFLELFVIELVHYFLRITNQNISQIYIFDSVELKNRLGWNPDLDGNVSKGLNMIDASG